MKLTQKGFAALEGLLILVIVGIIGGTGYYVWHSKSETDKALTISQPKQEAKPKEKAAYSGAPVESAQKGFIITVPDGWKVTNYAGSDNLRSDEISYKPGEPAKVENIDTPYAGDGAVRFQVRQFKDSEDFSYALSGEEQKVSFITSKGQKGIRYYVATPVTDEFFGAGDPLPGQETYTYDFKTAGKRTFVIYIVLNKNKYTEDFLKQGYNQYTSDINQIKLVDEVVKTLEIR